MSLDNTAENCELEDFPGSSQYPTVLNYMDSLALVVACGGEYLSDASKCWAFDGSSWTPLPNSTQHHCWHDTNILSVDQGWWVTGHLQTDNWSCSDSEWTSEIFTGDEWVQGPQHPTGYSVDSCLVQLNSTHTLYAGGYPTWSESWLYDWAGEIWTESGKLNGERYNHGCAVLKGEGVLLAGGFKNGYDYSVELYDTKTGIWTLQPSLPRDINPLAPTLLNWDGAMIALFYDTDQVYQRAGNGTWSALQGAVLPSTFHGYDSDGAVLVPDDFVVRCLKP